MGGPSNGSRQAEPVGEYLSRKLASQVQNDLDEYMTANPEFPVGINLTLACKEDG
jgi:syntaxin-binding protein 1